MFKPGEQNQLEALNKTHTVYKDDLNEESQMGVT